MQGKWQAQEDGGLAGREKEMLLAYYRRRQQLEGLLSGRWAEQWAAGYFQWPFAGQGGRAPAMPGGGEAFWPEGTARQPSGEGAAGAVQGAGQPRASRQRERVPWPGRQGAGLSRQEGYPGWQRGESGDSRAAGEGPAAPQKAENTPAALPGEGAAPPFLWPGPGGESGAFPRGGEVPEEAFPLWDAAQEEAQGPGGWQASCWEQAVMPLQESVGRVAAAAGRAPGMGPGPGPDLGPGLGMDPWTPGQMVAAGPSGAGAAEPWDRLVARLERVSQRLEGPGGGLRPAVSVQLQMGGAGFDMDNREQLRQLGERLGELILEELEAAPDGSYHL